MYTKVSINVIGYFCSIFFLAGLSENRMCRGARQRVEDFQFSKDSKLGSTEPYSISLPSKARKQSTTYIKKAKDERGLRRIRYASVNKRIRSLEELGHIKKVGAKKTKAGFQASMYDLTTGAYLAILHHWRTMLSVIFLPVPSVA